MAGMDMLVNAMLNAAGVDVAKVKEIASQIASDDTVNKMLAFSREIERQNNLLEEIRDELRNQRTIAHDTSAGRSGLEQLADYSDNAMPNGSITD